MAIFKRCPSTNCRAAQPAQRELTEPEKAEFEHAPWTKNAEICVYCGCVHTRDDRGRPVIRRP